MAGTISTTITSTYNLQAQYTTVLNTGAVIVASGLAISGTYVNSTYGWTLTNSGTILNSAAVSNGVDLRGIGNHVTNNAGGLISAVANAVYLARSGATVINAGSIAASGYNYSAVLLGNGGYVSNAATGTITSTNALKGHAVNIAGGLGSVVNAGLITNAETTNGADVNLTAGGSVSNAATGRIIAAARSGIYINNGAGTVTNAGTIMSAGNPAIDVNSDFGSVTNTGLIIETGGTSSALLLRNGAFVSNAAGGTIMGEAHTGIYVGAAVGTVVNDGLISGVGTTSSPGIAFGVGGAITNSALGTISSAFNPAFYVKTGVGTVINAGVIFETAGTSSALSLHDGAFISNAAGGTITGHAHNAIYVGTLAGTLFNSGLISGTGTSSSSGLAFNAGGYVSNAASGTISSVIGNAVYMKAAGTVVNAGILSVPTHSAIYFVGAAGTVVNSGEITGGISANGVHMIKGGNVTNLSGGTITGLGYNAVAISGGGSTIINDGALIGLGTSSPGVALQAGGYVNNQSGGTISGGGDGVAVTGGAGIVSNAGAISGAKFPGIYVNGGIGTVNNSGNVHSSLSTGLVLEATGSVTNQSGGTIGGATGVFVNGASGLVINAGTITGAGTGVLFSGSGTVVDAGVISAPNAVQFHAGSTNRLTVDPNAAFTGTVNGGNTIGSPIVSTLELASAASAGTLESIGTQFLNFGSIAFDPGADWFISGNTSGLAGTIGGFALGDTIEVTGITATGSSYASGVLTLIDTSGSVELTLPGTFTSATDFTVTNVAAGADITVTCFAAGTRIRTEHGDIPVECLRAGQLVMAHTGNRRMALHPIAWIGHRLIDCRSHPNPALVQPVRIRAGAFGPNRPQRDLLLSPDHAVFIAGVLIPVKYLINHRSIAQVPTTSVEYFHVELPAHAVLLAENLPVESYLDAGDRANFANGGATATLFPDFATRTWESRGCTTLIVTGPQLQAARAHLDRIASSHATVTCYAPAAAASA